MPTFAADTNSMTSIAGRLSGVVASLQSEAHGGWDTGALGHPAAVGALQRFVSNWSHGRSEITEGVKSVHAALSGSAGNYVAGDHAVATAYAQGARTAP